MSSKSYPEKYGPWALVVGASVGLGAAWAEECAKRGFNVIVCARRLEKLQEVTASLREKYGVETREFTVDISVPEGADKIIENVKDLDIGMCIYNAAIETGGYFIKVDEKYHLQQIVGNALVPMRVSWYLCREMARKNRGCILLCGSMAGIIGTANQASYGACKSFEMQLGETLWYEMRKYGVTVAGVTIGTVASPNFYEQQAEQGTGMDVDKSYEYDELTHDLNIDPAITKAQPHTPADVAKYVLDHVEDGPRLFSHYEDQLSYEGYTRMSRRDGCLFMGRSTDKYFSAYSAYALEGDDFKEVELKD